MAKKYWHRVGHRGTLASVVGLTLGFLIASGASVVNAVADDGIYKLKKVESMILPKPFTEAAKKSAWVVSHAFERGSHTIWLSTLGIFEHWSCAQINLKDLTATPIEGIVPDPVRVWSLAGGRMFCINRWDSKQPYSVFQSATGKEVRFHFDEITIQGYSTNDDEFVYQNGDKDFEIVTASGEVITKIPSQGLVKVQLLLTKSRLVAQGELNGLLHIRLYDRASHLLIAEKSLDKKVPDRWDTSATSPRMLSDKIFCYFDGGDWSVADTNSMKSLWQIKVPPGASEVVPIPADDLLTTRAVWLADNSKNGETSYLLMAADLLDGGHPVSLQTQAAHIKDVHPILFSGKTPKYLSIRKKDNHEFMTIQTLREGTSSHQIDLGDLSFVEVIGSQRFLALNKNTEKAEIVEIVETSFH